MALKENTREEERLTGIVGAMTFASIKKFMKGQGFEVEFEKPAPSKVRGVKRDNSRIYAGFVRREKT